MIEDKTPLDNQSQVIQFDNSSFNINAINPEDAKMIKDPIAEQSNGYSSCYFCCGCFIKTCCGQPGCYANTEIQSGDCGILLEFGKYVKILAPGPNAINTCTEKVVIINLRAREIRIQPQSLISSDNVTIYLGSSVTFKVLDPLKYYFKLSTDPEVVITYQVQNALKSVIAEHTLKELQSDRTAVEKKMTAVIDHFTQHYGIHTLIVATQGIQLPGHIEMAQRVAARTQKLSEAKIKIAEGYKDRAKISREGADMMGDNAMTLQLTYYDALKQIVRQQNTTVILPDSIFAKLGI